MKAMIGHATEETDQQILKFYLYEINKVSAGLSNMLGL